ncbi:MAG TPA: thrombospondin type 3 repeat-containing protein [Patescibacteria group bacterium]|nr:thrombospondin type 3 repeat-containing protein [Patescibacteria group bacterium]
MFGKPKEKTKKEKTPAANGELAARIHVMPERFYRPPKKKKMPLIIMIVAIILVLGGLIVAAIYLNFNLQKAEQPEITLNQPLNLNINKALTGNQNLNQNINLNANLNLATSTPDLTQATTTNVNLNANFNQNINVNANLAPIESLTPLSLASDSDGDGLTEAEENLFGTNAQASDSDNDTYSDGSELLVFYDPTKAAAPLSASSLFSTYRHPNYSIIYPSAWTLREADNQKNEVLFTSDTGEFVEILIINQAGNKTLNNWYQEQFPGVDFQTVTRVSINNLTGLRHPDNQSYYLMKNNDASRIYLITYNSGNFTELNFLITFQVMVKSFRVK